jgi:hypothetical protein
VEPVRVRVKRVIDFGSTVSIVGIDLASNEPVMVHIDHRPFEAVFPNEGSRGQSKPISFDADGLTLSLNIGPEELDGDGERRPRAAA